MRLPFYIDFGRALFAVALAILLYFVALSETNPADQRDLGSPVPVQPVNVPSGLVITTPDPEVRAVQPEPATVRLHLEEVREQVLPVRVNSTGQPPPGYQVGTPSVDPSRITVAGPASYVSRATEAVVDVSVDRLTVSINGVYTPRIVDERGNDLKDLNLRANPPAVTVQVPITQQTQYKEVGVRPIPV